jgi:hypothetical protein
MMAAPTIAPTDPIRATALLQEAVQIAEATKNSFASMNAHQSLALAHMSRGDPRAAAYDHLAAARLARRCGDRAYVCLGVAGVAEALAEAGELDHALLLGTWAARAAGWPDDSWTIGGVVHPSSVDALAARDALLPGAREQLIRDADAMDETDAITLAGTCVDRLGHADTADPDR